MSDQQYPFVKKFGNSLTQILIVTSPENIFNDLHTLLDQFKLFQMEQV